MDKAASSRMPAAGVALFVLAHPDDEIAFAPLLHRLARTRQPVRLVYLADGQAHGAPAALRSAETIAALAWLGIEAASLYFAGSAHAIADGTLYRHLPTALDALDRSVPPATPIDAIYTLAWEGGHADHDAAHLVAAMFAAARGLHDRLWQVAFYRAADVLPPPAFVVAAPLAANGPVQASPMTPDEQAAPRRMMRFYRSQWRSFAGLGPFIWWHSLTRRSFAQQRVRLDRLDQRPTVRPLLYERRNRIAFEEFQAAAAPFLAAGRAAAASVPAADPAVAASA